MFSMFLSVLNTHKSLGELEKIVETLTCRLMFPQHFLSSLTSTYVSITQ